MTFDQMVPSRFLKQSDFPKPGLLTIDRFEHTNVAREGDKPDNKWVVYFVEVEKGMVLGPTNLQLLKVATGVEGPEQARGKKVVVFVDPTISMGGKVVGGLRIRAPKGAAVAAPATEPTQESAESDDVPF